MPKLSNRHFNAENLTFADFSGGLNLTLPPESIAPNELQHVVNMEFDPSTGLFKIRGGMNSVYNFNDPVSDIFPIAGGDACLVRSGYTLYRLEGGVATIAGDVDGDKPGMFVYFGDVGNVACVFGGHVHIYDADTGVLSRVTSIDCPTAANTIMYRAGRIAVSEEGSDTIRYSGIGDPEKWQDDSDSDLTSKSVDVGYLDGCQITAVGSMVGEVIVFKAPPGQPEHGRIYRLQGEFPNWTIIQHSSGMAAWNSNAIQQVANNMLFLTREGMSSLATAMEYGDFKLSWAGAKINPKIANDLTDNCRLWQVAIRGQVWLWDGKSQDIYIYHYQIGQGAWTMFHFPQVVTAVASVAQNTYIAMGKTVYEMSDTLTDDNLWDELGSEDTRSDIEATWVPMTVIRNNQILVKKVRVNYLSTDTADARFKLEGLTLQLPVNGGGDIAATDDDIAALDTDPLTPNSTSVVRKRVNIVRWAITPQVTVTNGLFSLSSVGLEIAEV